MSLNELMPPIVHNDQSFISVTRPDLENMPVSSPSLLPTRATISKKIMDPTILTLTTLPRGSIFGTGGFVSVAAIKMLENDETTIRENWWTEARSELKSHARTLHCNHIIGYTEHASIVDDVVFMYCSGTAVILKPASLTKKHNSEKQVSRSASIINESDIEMPMSALESPRQQDEPTKLSHARGL